MAIAAGAKAPDFTLPDQDRSPVRLSDVLARGPVVLAFFPGAFSGTCTNEACTLRDAMASFNAVSAQVLGISVDSFFVLKAWRDAQQLNFPLLSDFNKEVTPLYGVLNPDMIGLKNLAYRAVFVIDRSGVIRHAEVLEDARNEPDYAAISQAVAAL